MVNSFGYQGAGNTPPATPTSSNPSTVVQATSYTLTVTGTRVNGSRFIPSTGGSAPLVATFSGTGIAVNSVTVVSDTVLTLTVSVAANASTGNRTLTVTNPNGRSVTSGNILYVIDRPVITAATITPTSPSSGHNLTAQVTSVINLDGSPLSFSYNWLENGISTGYTSAMLPHQATSAGKSYSCIITPAKGTLTGPAFTTAAVLIAQDTDNNKIQDEWELNYFGTNGVDPEADPDGDGVKNKHEYLFGLDPTNPKSKNGLSKKLNRSNSKFAYTRPAKKLDGVVYKVWVSTNLVTWTEQTVYTQVVTSLNSQSEQVEVQLPAALTNAEKKLFVRVSAEP